MATGPSTTDGDSLLLDRRSAQKFQDEQGNKKHPDCCRKLYMCLYDGERFHCSVPTIIIHFSISTLSLVHHERSCVSAPELVSVTKHGGGLATKPDYYAWL